MTSKTMGVENMGNRGMKKAREHTQGYTLIASLLLMTLLSAMAIGLMMMVNTEGKVGGFNLQNNVAYHSAEGGIENMVSDLAATFQNSQSPTVGQICAVGNTPPAMPGVTWETYSVSPASGSGCSGDPNLKPPANWGQLSSGPDQGLWAQIIPVNLEASADLVGGQEVSMRRTAQVALIPVFQFGVFSDSDLAFFSNPTLDFNGRVHTNGDLYVGVAPGNTIEFHSKVEAYGNIVTNDLPNTLPADGSTNDNGTVYMPTADVGCVPKNPPAQNPPTDKNCVTMAKNRGSVTGKGGHPPGSAYNGTGGWYDFSKNKTNGEVINGNYGNTAVNQTGTGAKRLSMPFVGGYVLPYEIIRRSAGNEDPASALATSREYNMAQIRVLLSDDPADLPGGASDVQNVRLANLTPTQATATGATSTNPYGITMAAGNYPSSFAAGTYQLYFAAASNAVPSAGFVTGASNGTDIPDWPLAPLAWYGNAQNTSPTQQGLQPKGPAGGPGAPIVTGSNASVAPVLTLCPPGVVLKYARPANCPATPPSPYYLVNNTPAVNDSTALNAGTATWNLIDGYLRVEYKDASGNWNPVTIEWLNLGFARGTTPPTAPGSNPVNPNAILLLQEPADRSTTTSGTLPTFAQLSTGLAPTCTATSSGKCTAWTATPPLLRDTGATQWEFGTSTTAQSVTAFNWYPINFYDAREGEARDVIQGGNSCTTNGVMNAVEIDVGNLERWLRGQTGSSGPHVDFLDQNGYVLYFSDERGMLLNPNTTGPHPAGSKSGDSGLEDVVNAASQAGTPDGSLETPGGTDSPEDVNQNGQLDNFGVANLGLGFYNGAANLNGAIVGPHNPYSPRITSCSVTGRKNWVSGARHVLKLVDGSLGNVPKRWDAAASLTSPGGFTVASENPVYIQGDYNSDAADTFFTNPTTTAPANDIAGHSAAAVIADAVTILSNSWDDRTSMGVGNLDVTDATTRPASTTYYRLAIAGGKNRSFPFPAWAKVNPDYPFGTDGGLGNFLRFLEDWQSSGTTLHYGGSLVSLYYATYGTGIFKCCTYSVYQPPNRDYLFDADFTLPEGLPPGTPMFRDVESLGYRQMLTTRDPGQ